MQTEPEQWAVDLATDIDGAASDYEDAFDVEAAAAIIEAKLKEYEARERAILQAMHDAINRPKGVVPASAEPFYDARQAMEADHAPE